MPLAPALAETRLALDTDVFTHWRNNHSYVLTYVDNYFRTLKELPALTSMTSFEALSGVEEELVKGKITEGRARQYRSQIEQLIGACPVLPFDGTAAFIAAYIFPRLSQSDRNKHWQDVFITATALAQGYGIASRNRKDFELIAAQLPPSHSLLRLAVWKP